MTYVLIALQLLGIRDRYRPVCVGRDIVNVELCERLFISGWGLFVGSVVAACIFHWLTEHVPWMHGWWKRAEKPIWILLCLVIVIFIVLMFATDKV